MSTNAPTSRRIMYLHCHVDGVSLEVFFFSKKNISFPLFSKLHFVFLFCFTLWILFQFVFLLTLHFQSSSNLSSPYTFFLYIKGIIAKKFDLNFFKELFWSLSVLWPNLRNPTWILSYSFIFFEFLGDFQPNFKKLDLNYRKKSSPLQTCKYFFFKCIYIFWSLVGVCRSQWG